MKPDYRAVFCYAAWLTVLPALVLFAPAAWANDSQQLIELINAYRQSPGQCEGKQQNAAPALTPDPVLSRVKVTPGGDLQQSLKDAGYQAAKTEAVVLTGPASATQVMDAISERYCRSLMRPEFSAIGIARSGDQWRILLAQPLLSSDLGEAFSAGRKVLELVNEARAQPRTCGSRRFPSSRPLAWNEALARAALAHSADMAKQNYFNHEGKDGSHAAERAQRAGYQWRLIGENIAAGQGSAREAVAGWLASPGHCANIMNRDFTEMGAAYAVNPKSDTTISWTQVFGTPR